MKIQKKDGATTLKKEIKGKERAAAGGVLLEPGDLGHFEPGKKGQK